MSVTMHQDQAAISEFLSRNNVGVLATASCSGVPHAATIYFVTDKDLNFYFVTKEKTTKYKNLIENKHAALAVFQAQTQSTLQVSGVATVIKDVNKFMDLYNQILEISAATSDSDRPPVSKLFAGDYFMFCLAPHKIRLAEYTKPDHGNTDIFEIVTPISATK